MKTVLVYRFDEDGTKWYRFAIKYRLAEYLAKGYVKA